MTRRLETILACALAAALTVLFCVVPGSAAEQGAVTAGDDKKPDEEVVPTCAC